MNGEECSDRQRAIYSLDGLVEVEGDNSPGHDPEPGIYGNYRELAVAGTSYDHRRTDWTDINRRIHDSTRINTRRYYSDIIPKVNIPIPFTNPIMEVLTKKRMVLIREWVRKRRVRESRNGGAAKC